MNAHSRTWVAGRDTLLGGAIFDALRRHGLGVIDADEPALTDHAQVEDFFGEHRPEYVFLAGGLSGGIELNRRRPATLMQDNLLTVSTILDAAHRHGVRRLLYLASCCGYPRLAPQPMAVDSLFTGPLEPTSAAYATAKLAGLVLCDAYRREHGCDFIAAIPANAFGPGDDFGSETGHVVPALLRRAHEAKVNGDRELVVWGTGQARREFVYAPDLADAAVFVMRNHAGPGPINLGGGESVSIAELAGLILEVVGYTGTLRFDAARPDGQPVKVLDTTPLRDLGWRPRTGLHDALRETYEWFVRNVGPGGLAWTGRRTARHETPTGRRPVATIDTAKEGTQDEDAAVPRAVPHPAARGGGSPRLPHR